MNNGRPQVCGADDHEATENEEQRPLLRELERNSARFAADATSITSVESSILFERLAGRAQERDREKLKREFTRYTSFIWAIISWSVLNS